MADKTPKNTADILTHLSNVLPTGTFLVFQVLAPLATNNGDCHNTEKVVTSAALVILSALCFFTCYTDSYKTDHGTLYYGLVTSRGLWNLNFKHTHNCYPFLLMQIFWISMLFVPATTTRTKCGENVWNVCLL
ncbi:hypothetical protein CY35_07G052500 [Sphagnum magellanicum]|uniref:Uncharacterized protein n=1 Tax=Sphagnum magellanicum TaxID=128215 RepID=A0ACB8HKU7_9BRYO|nr:hypothetical protein CY35_07G052500 [Sphagnum magellanicum]